MPSFVNLIVSTAVATTPSGSTGGSAAITGDSLTAIAGSTFVFQPEPGETITASEVPPPFGAQGSTRWNVQLGYGLDVKGSNQQAIGGVGLSHFFAEDLSVDIELNGAAFFQDGSNAVGGNFNLLFRWHFLARDTWSIYLDGGAGLLGTASDVPDSGSSFNFTPQAGVGFSLDVGNDTRLMAGVRWHHISNANTYRENPGRDSIMIYGMLSFAF